MACRDCVWWDLKTLRSIRGDVKADCSFNAVPLMESIPLSISTSSLGKIPTEPEFGEGCPQFKERTDGE